LEEHKICTHCGIKKPLSLFAFDNRKKDKRACICKNCQALRSYKHRKEVRKEFYDELERRLKLKGKKLECEHCGNICRRSLQFHHINPDEKEADLARYLEVMKRWEEAFKEIDKCMILCGNCHQLEHQKLTIEKWKEYEKMIEQVEALKKFYQAVTGNDPDEVDMDIVNWEISRVLDVANENASISGIPAKLHSSVDIGELSEISIG